MFVIRRRLLHFTLTFALCWPERTAHKLKDDRLGITWHETSHRRPTTAAASENSLFSAMNDFIAWGFNKIKD